MFENLSIRSKIVAIVAAPIAALLIVSGIGAFQRRATASDSRADEQLIAITQADVSVASALGIEGVLSATPGSSTGGPTSKLAASRRATDRAAAVLRTKLKTLASDGTPEAQTAATNILTRLDGIGTLRRALDNGQTATDLLTQAFPSATSEILALPTTLVAQVHTPEVAARLQDILALARYQASVATTNALLAPAVATGQFVDIPTADKFRRSAQTETQDQAVFESNASPAARALLRSAQSGQSVNLVDAIRDGAVNSAAGLGAGTDVGTWSAAVQDKLERIDGVGQKLTKQLASQASANSDAASSSANLFLLFALLAIVIAIGLAYLLARAITRPLRKLTTAAQELSTEQLPRLVESLRNPASQDVGFLRSSVGKLDVRSRDEVGQLAEAFNTVQEVAVEVATEQAELLRKGIGDMFVNLARRNQALFDRQIEFIDELETNEEDADQLQHLFHLDHLATRMRRNAESLLVLAGAEPNRRRGRPVALTDVVRAALGEVEDFARIDLLELEDVLVTSNAAADVAHLLSELMENATNFSPPDTRVEVVGHRTNAEGYVVSITDTGIGMSPEQMAEANETLENPPLVGLSMSRSLGFIVIGRLAARFGISVRLMSSPTGGVTAVVAMPSVIIHELQRDMPLRPEEPAETTDETSPSDRWTPQVVDSGSDLLAPLEFTPFGADEPPATFDDAVPGGRAFEAGVSGLVPSDDDRAADEATDDDDVEEAPKLPSLGPSRRPDRPPSGREDGDEAPARPRLFGPPAEAASGPQAPAEPAVTNGSGLPARNGKPPAPVTADLPERLPTAAAPAVSDAAVTDDPPGKPGLFDAPDGDGAAEVGAGPEPLPITEPAPVVTSRLFGQVGNRPGPGSAETGAGAVAAPGLDTLPTRSGAESASPSPNGLARRSPRKPGGGERPRPGGDGSPRQGVVATKRSPDEVRSLLSNYRSGASKARATTDKPTDAPNPEGDA